MVGVVVERSSLLLDVAAVGRVDESRVREVVASGDKNLQETAAADEEAITRRRGVGGGLVD